jgi:hypothetical protein
MIGRFYADELHDAGSRLGQWANLEIPENILLEAQLSFQNGRNNWVFRGLDPKQAPRSYRPQTKGRAPVIRSNAAAHREAGTHDFWIIFAGTDGLNVDIGEVLVSDGFANVGRARRDTQDQQ